MSHAIRGARRHVVKVHMRRIGQPGSYSIRRCPPVRRNGVSLLCEDLRSGALSCVGTKHDSAKRESWRGTLRRTDVPVKPVDRIRGTRLRVGKGQMLCVSGYENPVRLLSCKALERANRRDLRREPATNSEAE